MKKQETVYVPKIPNFIPNITNKERTKMVNWFSNVCEKLNFKSETLFLAVNIADRILSLNNFPTHLLAIIAGTALYIAVKV